MRLLDSQTPAWPLLIKARPFSGNDAALGTLPGEATAPTRGQGGPAPHDRSRPAGKERQCPRQRQASSDIATPASAVLLLLGAMTTATVTAALFGHVVMQTAPATAAPTLVMTRTSP